MSKDLAIQLHPPALAVQNGPTLESSPTPEQHPNLSILIHLRVGELPALCDPAVRDLLTLTHHLATTNPCDNPDSWPQEKKQLLVYAYYRAKSKPPPLLGVYCFKANSNGQQAAIKEITCILRLDADKLRQLK